MSIRLPLRSSPFTGCSSNVDCGAVLLALISWSDGNMAGICFGSSKSSPLPWQAPHIANVLSFEDPVAP